MHQPLAPRMVQVEEDARYLQGSMRFMGSLFREHHLPYALIRTLVTDLTSHSEKVCSIYVSRYGAVQTPSTAYPGCVTSRMMLGGPRRACTTSLVSDSPQSPELAVL